MFYSGLVVTCAAKDFHCVHEKLMAVDGIDIHQTDPETGRFVIVLEEETIEAETERFSMLKKIDGVVDVSLVVHREDGE